MRVNALFRSLLLMLTVVVCSFGHGQPRNRANFAPNVPVYVETHSHPTEQQGKSRLDILFRITRSFFIFVKNPSTLPSPPFVAHPEVMVELYDTSHTTVARDFIRSELTTSSPRTDEIQGRYIEGNFNFLLTPGHYFLNVEINDKESSRHYLEGDKPVLLRDFSGRPPILSDVTFLARGAGGSDTLHPVNFGGDLPFGESVFAYLEIASETPPESLSLVIDIYAAPTGKAEHIRRIHDSLSAGLHSSRSLICPLPGPDHTAAYMLCDSIDHPRIFSWSIPIDSDTLPPGTYELEARLPSGAGYASTRQSFHVRWIDMPRSLRNPELTVEALRYIADEKEYNDLKSASDERRQTLLEEFWERRAKTLSVPSRTLMKEFYTRVDYAMDNFQTPRQPNGMKTDRGKAYILYGPPTSTDRELTPGSPPREVWRYASLHKVLVFEDESRQGDYKLHSTEEF